MSGRAIPARSWRDLSSTGRFCVAFGVLLVLMLVVGFLLYVLLSAGRAEAVAPAEVDSWVAITLAGIVATGLVGGALLVWLLRPVIRHDTERLFEAVSRLEAGTMDGCAESARHTDIAGLAQTVDAIAEHLQTRIRELERQQELLQTIFDNIPVVVDMYDERGRLCMANPEWERTFGWTVRESLGKRMLEEFYPNPKDLRAAADSITAADPGWNEFRQTTRSGREVDMLWADIRLSDGSIIGIGQDITERKQHEQALYAYSELLESMVSERTQELETAQERLVRQEKLAALGQLAGGVSHELRNPLGVISNAVYLLRMMLTEGAEKTLGEYLEIIEAEVARAEKIVNDLLEFGRVRVADRQAIAVHSLVGMTLDAYGVPDNVQVRTEISDDLPSVLVDSYQIQQVLGNLILNACQAMPKGGEVSISATYEPSADGAGRVRMCVHDTGGGISVKNMPRLFEPLFTTKPRGVGLGLAISRNLVEANGGRLAIESVEGQGTTAAMTLPISHEQSHDEYSGSRAADMED